MFIINGTSTSQDTRRFVFESITIARVIADKLEGQGYEVEILDQGGDLVTQTAPDPYRRLLGAHI